MANPSNPNDIIQRILNGTQTDDDVEALRQWLNHGGIQSIQNLQVGKYNVNIGQGKNVNIGDKTYQGLDAEAIREVARAVVQGSNATDIREIVRSILKEEYPDRPQLDHPSNSDDSKTKNLQSILSNVQTAGNISIGSITQIYNTGEIAQPNLTSENPTITFRKTAINRVDELVQQVRIRIHNTIQSLHGT
ncbi:hypothetical protein [Plectonema radiosum]|uniref:hypothetical protein n=1 Tax=Plectonema radiosum TaxID=945768 RepID=UPI001D139DF2|nr:hypothetical protein [Plectonema radiosum]